MPSNMFILSGVTLLLTVRLYYFSDTDANINIFFGTYFLVRMENKLLA